jgi:hypothetical protein
MRLGSLTTGRNAVAGGSMLNTMGGSLAHLRLFRDFLYPAPRALVLLSPPGEERLTVHASVAPGDGMVLCSLRAMLMCSCVAQAEALVCTCTTSGIDYAAK